MFTAPAHSHLACLELMETVLKMSVALRVPAGKRWHTHTGQPKELNKGITCIGLGRVQGGWQGWEVVTARSPRPDVTGKDWVLEPRESSDWERVPTGEAVFLGPPSVHTRQPPRHR